jgi:hypothetical protein
MREGAPASGFGVGYRRRVSGIVVAPRMWGGTNGPDEIGCPGAAADSGLSGGG